jgi:hypothetical protein
MHRVLGVLLLRSGEAGVVAQYSTFLVAGSRSFLLEALRKAITSIAAPHRQAAVEFSVNIVTDFHHWVNPSRKLGNPVLYVKIIRGKILKCFCSPGMLEIVVKGLWCRAWISPDATAM